MPNPLSLVSTGKEVAMSDAESSMLTGGLVVIVLNMIFGVFAAVWQLIINGMPGD